MRSTILSLKAPPFFFFTISNSLYYSTAQSTRVIPSSAMQPCLNNFKAFHPLLLLMRTQNNAETKNKFHKKYRSSFLLLEQLDLIWKLKTIATKLAREFVPFQENSLY